MQLIDSPPQVSIHPDSEDPENPSQNGREYKFENGRRVPVEKRDEAGRFAEGTKPGPGRPIKYELTPEEEAAAERGRAFLAEYTRNHPRVLECPRCGHLCLDEKRERGKAK
jgi:hypothetical protein